MDFITMDHVLYLIYNFMRAYVIFRLIQVFLDKNTAKQKNIVLGFILFFVITSCIELAFTIPNLNLIVNIGSIFMLTHLYNGKLGTRLIATAFVYCINLFWESIAYVIMIHFKLDNGMIFPSCMVAILFLLLIILVLEKLVNMKKNHHISKAHWMAIFLIPTFSILLGILIVSSTFGTILILIGIIGIFILNLSVFYLYDALMKSYEEKNEKELLAQQNKAYQNQFDLIRQSQQSMRMLRHDLKNHILALEDMISKEKKEESLEYLNNMLQSTRNSEEYVSSGNESVDSILNYKIHEAKQHQAEVSTSVQIPEKLCIKPFDLNVILGNLMDNAIDALKQSQEKALAIKLELERGILYLKITNSFSGKVIIEDGELKTTQRNKEIHGIGLSSVKNIVGKYNGSLTFDYNSNEFTADVLLYNVYKT